MHVEENGPIWVKGYMNINWLLLICCNLLYKFILNNNFGVNKKGYSKYINKQGLNELHELHELHEAENGCVESPRDRDVGILKSFKFHNFQVV